MVRLYPDYAELGEQTQEAGAMHWSYGDWAGVFPLLFDWLADRLS